ncbi:MAG: Bacterial regulatory protein luxR family [Chloroflexota bacterium]|jgi:DNA-binding CsgD family transcriptional regulator|nr:Bacterial regulatory protein luxR family [Chloroflexota bacterium]
MESPRTSSAGNRPLRLTGREREVLALVEHGLTNAEIARRMSRRRPTVARLLSNAMTKLGADRRAQAVVLAAEMPEAAGSARSSTDHPPADHHLSEMEADARAILRGLAHGKTLGQAAGELGLSRRTADRRLAHARRALGTDRTVVAVASARRRGWLV